MDEAKKFLKERLFYDPETEEIFGCRLDVMASTMEMYAKMKYVEWKKKEQSKSIDGEELL